MTPYIPFYRRALLHPLTIPFRRSSSSRYTDLEENWPHSTTEGALHEGNNTLRAFELRCLERESLVESILIGKRLKALARVNHISREKSMRWINEGV